MGQLSIDDFAANANKLQLCQSRQLTNDTRPRGNIKRLTRWGGTERGKARRKEVLATQLNILLTWRPLRCLKGDFVVLAWWCVDCWLLTTSLPPLLLSSSPSLCVRPPMICKCMQICAFVMSTQANRESANKKSTKMFLTNSTCRKDFGFHFGFFFFFSCLCFWILYKLYSFLDICLNLRACFVWLNKKC